MRDLGFNHSRLSKWTLIFVCMILYLQIFASANEESTDFLRTTRLHFGRDTPHNCKNAFNELNIEDSPHKFSKGERALVGAPCFGDDSIGNSFSVYVEGRICAHVAGVTYVAAPKYEPSLPKFANHSFFRGLPAIAKPATPAAAVVSQADVDRVCPCQSICHEWNYGLMHKNMPLAGRIFREGMDSYWSDYLSQRPNELQLELIKPDSGSKIAWRKLKIDINANFIKDDKTNVKEIGILPAIPDVAVHYRCGDNLVTHYGFLPFSAIKNSISASDRFIYIMAEDPNRRTDKRRKDRCKAILDGLLDYLMRHFPDKVVVLLRGHDLYQDLARLTYAKTTVCSVSTFCLWPAVASNTTAYYPVTKLIAKEDTSFDYGPSFHWLKDPRYRVLRGVEAAAMADRDVLKYLSRD